MPENKLLKPDYLFEVSWEVCNKVGGIHTVISTKAITMVKTLKDNFIMIGPDVWKETRTNPEFIEDKYLYKSWREKAEDEGHKLKVGRWNVAGKPVVILVDFTPYFSLKDKILAHLWERFQLDSLTGQWDYIEPAMFGYAAARLIESFYQYNLSSQDKLVTQFHEWMTGAGALDIKENLPQAACVFTTHATVMGRCIAGNSMPLYREMESYDGEAMARQLGVLSKYSLEKITAGQSDCFTTVSDITARECKHFLDKEPDVVTPNGFEDSFVPGEAEFDDKREVARKKIFEVATAVTGYTFPEDTMLVINSGRYEFRNKGIDLFIDALGALNRNGDINREILAIIAVPAGNRGPRKSVQSSMETPASDQIRTDQYLTHSLLNPDSDPVIDRIKQNELRNLAENKVKILFVPCYLNGDDGIFDLPYYDLLIGFDLSVFPSYYEPWGYTPLESIAFHIPTISTTLAGFGIWAMTQGEESMGCVAVIERTDDNDAHVTEEIASRMQTCNLKSHEERSRSREMAFGISRNALWENLIMYYWQAYSIALRTAATRSELYKTKQPEGLVSFKRIVHEKPDWKKLLIKPSIPDKFNALQELTKNMWWTWNQNAQELFEFISPELWIKTGRNPISLLESLTLEDFQKLEENTDFMNRMQSVHHEFSDYMSLPRQEEGKVAYFSMEYGIHDSLKIFSGGLGVLAGDYLKEASDSNKNIIGLGLLYRYGYFQQNISLLGDQLALYPPQKFSQLPLTPVREKNGNGQGSWIKVSLPLPGRPLFAKVWKVEVGRIPLYLLDTDIEENNTEDRTITHRLYGGDSEMRFKQELLLGIGGIRILEALDMEPEIYHCNEGHAAFLCVERLRKLIQDKGISFLQALEVVRASMLFTTHTPVPAGHDVFTEDMIRMYVPHYAERLNITWEDFMNLGRFNENDITEKFSMSVLAAKLSSQVNGVSRIHGRVTRELFNGLYPGYFPEELHIGYVTNGVHLPTWVAPRWRKLYDTHFDQNYIHDQSNSEYWKKIYDVPDETLWDIRNAQRADLIAYIKDRMKEELTHRQENPKSILNTVKGLNENALTIGFARRFATYKRAHLLFSNPERLACILGNQERPVQIIYAGKAHPNDKAGQDLIKKIHEFTRKAGFSGKIIFLENYDLALGQRLVQGVDVWLNTPTRPMEASGTSGEKAVMNGVINFSVLDGWWAEGYLPEAGWALKEERTYTDRGIQDELDAETIYDILENEIIPAFYSRCEDAPPQKWISYIKNTIALIAPRFTMKRMIDDYYEKFYSKLFIHGRKMSENNYAQALSQAAWKQKLIRGWNSIEVVSFNMTDSNRKPLTLGEKFRAEIVLNLNELSGTDICIEVIFGQKINDVVDKIAYLHEMNIKETDGKLVTFACEIPAERVGVFDFAFRMVPKNELVPHRQDFNLVKWL